MALYRRTACAGSRRHGGRAAELPGAADLHLLLERATAAASASAKVDAALARLTSALNALPAQQRLVLNLVYQDELTFTELGLVLDLTEAAARQRHEESLHAVCIALATGQVTVA